MEEGDKTDEIITEKNEENHEMNKKLMKKKAEQIAFLKTFAESQNASNEFIDPLQPINLDEKILLMGISLAIDKFVSKRQLGNQIPKFYRLLKFARHQKLKRIVENYYMESLESADQVFINSKEEKAIWLPPWILEMTAQVSFLQESSKLKSQNVFYILSEVMNTKTYPDIININFDFYSTSQNNQSLHLVEFEGNEEKTGKFTQ